MPDGPDKTAPEPAYLRVREDNEALKRLTQTILRMHEDGEAEDQSDGKPNSSDGSS